MKKHQRIFVSGASLVVLCQAAIAVAETAGPPAAAGGDQALEEIVVTAQHRAERVQVTPIAISAITGEKLQEEHITTFQALATTDPDVQFSDAIGDARIFIRGVGLDSLSPGSDPRVAIYTDQVYNARPQTGLMSFFDLDRVEILKGPQGTLYGRNATAGAINVISRDPGTELNGYGTVTVGNYGLVQTEGAIGGPLTDKIAGRIAATTTDHDGYGVNIGTGSDVDDRHRRAARAKLEVKPTDYATIMFQADYADEADHAGGFHFIKDTPGNEAFGEEQGFAVPSNPHDYAGQGPNQTVRAFGGSMLATINLDDFVLTSVTGYRRLTSGQETNADSSTAGFIPANYFEKSEEVTEEVRLARSFGPVDVQVGGYFFHENNSALVVTPFASSAYFPAFAQTANCCIGIPKETGPFARLQGEYAGGAQYTDAYALFTQETFHITDSLGLDLGGRYSFEKRDIGQFFQFDLARPAGIQPILAPGFASYATQHKSWNSLNPSVSLHYKINDDIFAYATYTTGFKSGGFNFAAIQPAFNPEKLTDYELGVKADLWDKRLRVDLAAFHYKYAQLQVNTTFETALLTTNAAGADVDGVAAQISAEPMKNLRIDFNAAWLDGRYTDYTTGDPGRPALGDISLAGNRLQYAPRWKFNGQISYRIKTDWGDFRPRIDLTWTDRLFFSQYNLSYNAQNSYLLANLYLDYDLSNGWYATAFAQNVTDKTYIIAATQSALFLGAHIVGLVGEPRTFGVSVSKSF